MKSISKVDIHIENSETHKEEIITLWNFVKMDMPMILYLMMTEGYPCNVFANKDTADYIQRIMGNVYEFREIQGPSLRELLREVINDSIIN